MSDNVFSSESQENSDNILISAESVEQAVEAPVLEESVVEVTPEPVSVISSPEPKVETPVAEQLLVVSEEPKVETPVESVTGDTVALYSTHNLHQSSYGELSVGYNIVKKEKADFWLRSKKVRLATPEEVAKHYNK